MRFLFLILVGVLVISITACQSITNTIDVQWKMNSRAWIEIGPDAASKLLGIIQNNPKNEKAWKALHHYSSFTDAGITLTFYRDCFNALKEKPLLFFDRYMVGDEQALFRMIDAFSHDFSAFSGETFQATNQVLQQSLDSIVEFMVAHAQEREVYRRAYNFERVSQSQYASWKLLYCDLTKENSRVIFNNCAP